MFKFLKMIWYKIPELSYSTITGIAVSIGFATTLLYSQQPVNNAPQGYFSVTDVVFVGVVGFLVIIVLLILGVIMKNVFNPNKIKIKRGQTEVTMSNNESDIISPVYNDFKRKLYDKLSLVVIKTIDIYNKIRSTEDSILREQMIYTEQRMELLREIDLRLYLTILDETVVTLDQDILLKSDEYQNYINLLYRVYQEVLVTFRMFYKENHLLEKTESEWMEYKHDKIDYVLSKMNKILDIGYSSNAVVTRSKLYDETTKQVTPGLKHNFEEIFNEARKIANTKQVQSIELRKELDEFVLNMLK